MIFVPLALNCWSTTVYSVELSLHVCSTVLHSQELECWRGLSLYGSVKVGSTPWETEGFISTLIFKMLNFLFLSVSKVTWRERLWFVTPFPSQRVGKHH